MKASVFYRIASILLILFAAGHTIGFRNADPKWNIGSVIQSMQSSHFEVQGFTRTYWDFFVGFGLFVSVLLVFAAVAAWQLGGLPPDTLASMRLTGWAVAASFVVVTFLSWRYFFVIPLAFSLLITICLIVAAWLSNKPSLH